MALWMQAFLVGLAVFFLLCIPNIDSLRLEIIMPFFYFSIGVYMPHTLLQYSSFVISGFYCLISSNAHDIFVFLLGLPTQFL